MRSSQRATCSSPAGVRTSTTETLKLLFKTLYSVLNKRGRVSGGRKSGFMLCVPAVFRVEILTITVCVLSVFQLDAKLNPAQMPASHHHRLNPFFTHTPSHHSQSQFNSSPILTPPLLNASQSHHSITPFTVSIQLITKHHTTQS